MTVTTAAPPPDPEPPVPGHPDRFVRPSPVWNLLLQPGIVSVTVLSLSGTAYDTVAAKVPVPPRKAIQAFTVGAYLLHVFEAVVAFRTAKRIGQTRSARRWALETLVLGFPVILSLRKLEGPR